MGNLKKNVKGSFRNILALSLTFAVVCLISLLQARGKVDDAAYFAIAPVLSNVKPDQVNVSWNVFPGFNGKTHYQVQLNHSLYGSSLKGTVAQVQNLAPGGIYDFAIVTYHNGSVAGVSSATRLQMPPGTPAGLNVYDIGSASFRVIWEQVQTAQRYRLYRFPDVLLAEVDDPGNKAFVTGLTAGERLLIYMTAVNSTGESYKSEAQTVQLLPPPPALSLAEGEIGQDWFGMTWNAVENAQTYVVIINEVEVARLASDTLTYRAENLLAGTTVSVKMKAENSSGLSEESEAIIVQLLPATPVLAAGDISSISCILQWSVATGSTYYKVFENDEWCIFNVPSTINQVVVSQNVSEGMTATYTVKAGNGTGESTPSNSVVVTFSGSASIQLDPVGATSLLPSLLQMNQERLASSLQGTPLVSVYFPADLSGPELALEASWLNRLAAETSMRKIRFFGVFTGEPAGIKISKRENIDWKVARKDSRRYFLPGNIPLVRFYDSDGWLRHMARVSMLILTPEDVFKELPEAFEENARLIELYREEKESFENLHLNE